MGTDLPQQGQADEGALRQLAEALRKREELVALREQMLDAMTEFRQSQSDDLQDQLKDGRDANAQLVIASLRMQDAAEVAEQDSRRKDEFIAMLSHELRNPLAAMHNVINILGRISNAEPRLPWIHGVLDRQVGQLTRLLDDLLDAARVRTGKLVLKKQRIALQAVIEQAIEACRPSIDARGQWLTVQSPAPKVWVYGDPARLTQVFSNLIHNASKYTQQAGRLSVRLSCTDTTSEVCIADNGYGIAADALSRIFELFEQEDQSLAHSDGGLGIGLALARKLLHLHQGTVSAFSAGRGLGSVFTVELPLATETSSTEATQQVPAAPSAGTKSSLSIVLIEDNPDANESLAALLRMVGHAVFSAYDGQAGVALVLAVRPQVVLCDLGLPLLDGLQVAARLRSAIEAPQPLLVALTGYGQSGDFERSLAAGFDAHLVKPIEPHALLTLLHAHSQRVTGSELT